MKMTPNEKYYWELSEVYLAMYENHLARDYKIMVAKGATVEMWSDLLKYIKSKGQDERAIKQQERLSLIEKALDEFGGICSSNDQMKVFLRNYLNKIEALKKENKDLKDKLEAIEKAWNQQ